METIDKLAWILIKDKKVLYLRSKGKTLFYNAGGKRELGETDEQTLTREIKEELNVDLISDTIKYLKTFTSQASGKPDGTLVQIKCFTANYVGDLKVGLEIEEMSWLTSSDINKTTATGQLILNYLKEQNLII